MSQIPWGRLLELSAWMWGNLRVKSVSPRRGKVWGSILFVSIMAARRLTCNAPKQAEMPATIYYSDTICQDQVTSIRLSFDLFLPLHNDDRIDYPRGSGQASWLVIWLHGQQSVQSHKPMCENGCRSVGWAQTPTKLLWWEWNVFK